MQASPQPLTLTRNVTDPALANVAIGLANPGAVASAEGSRCRRHAVGGHRAAADPRLHQAAGFRRLQLLDSAQGVAIRPNAEDVAVERAPDKIIDRQARRTDVVVGRDLRRTGADGRAAAVRYRRMAQQPEENSSRAQDALIRLPRPPSRTSARRRGSIWRVSTCRARMYHGSQGRHQSDPFRRRSAHRRIRRADGACDREHPDGTAGAGPEGFCQPRGRQQLRFSALEGLAYARQGKWAEAREKFKNVEFAIASLPLELQRIVTMDAMRASLEVKDYAGAAKRRGRNRRRSACRRR